MCNTWTTSNKTNPFDEGVVRISQYDKMFKWKQPLIGPLWIETSENYGKFSGKRIGWQAFLLMLSFV